ncbi:MAG: hypothetical protein ABJB05_09930 [Parafilimonas sp.]
MKKCLFVFIILIIGTVSCQKGITDSIDSSNNGGDNNGGNGSDSSNSIIGTWDFIKLNAQTQITNESDISGISAKIVAVMGYTSINNSGTITFDASNMTATGLTYGVDANITTYTYQNNLFQDSLIQATSFELPATTSTVNYKMITSDSLYFPEGGFTVQTSTPTVQSAPSGGRISFSGDTLILNQNLAFDSTSTANGIVSHITGNVMANIFMKKHQ